MARGSTKSEHFEKSFDDYRMLLIEEQKKQKAVANCVWMLVVKIEGIERIY